MEASTKAEAYAQATVEHPAKKWVIYTAQILIYPGLLGLRFLLVKNRLTRHPELVSSVRRGNGFIIYANHQSMLDPLIICSALPIRVLLSLMPFRFFVANNYFSSVGRGLSLRLLGGFPAHFDNIRPYGIDHAKHSLNTKQTVMIFPQGTRTRQKIAKPGISLLANEQDIGLIPIHIEWKHRLHCEVNIGKPFEVSEFRDADNLMDEVYGLG